MELTLPMFVPSLHFCGFCAAALERQLHGDQVLTPALGEWDESSRNRLLGG